MHEDTLFTSRGNRKETNVKQTLLDIKRKTAVTTQALAERAQLSVADVFVVETGGFSSRERAQKVIDAFNQLSGMQIQIEDIKIYQSNLNCPSKGEQVQTHEQGRSLPFGGSKNPRVRFVHY